MASDNCDCDRFSMLKGFRSSCFRAKISPRAYRRGIQFAMEDYLSNVLVEEDSGGILFMASCFASYEKKRKRKVSVRLGDVLNLLCEAPLVSALPVRGIAHMLLVCCIIWRPLLSTRNTKMRRSRTTRHLHQKPVHGGCLQ